LFYSSDGNEHFGAGVHNSEDISGKTN